MAALIGLSPLGPRVVSIPVFIAAGGVTQRVQLIVCRYGGRLSAPSTPLIGSEEWSPEVFATRVAVPEVTRQRTHVAASTRDCRKRSCTGTSKPKETVPREVQSSRLRHALLFAAEDGSNLPRSLWQLP